MNYEGRNRLRGSKRIKRVETDYEGRNELRGSKQITRVETNYEGRNELRGSKRIIKLETNYEGRNELDRKSTRLNSSHQIISYAVFCLKKKKKDKKQTYRNKT